MQAFVVWASLVPPIPFLLLSWLIEGAAGDRCGDGRFQLAIGGRRALPGLDRDAARLRPVEPPAVALSGQPGGALRVAGALVGLTSGWLVYGERLQAVHFAGGALLMAGLAVNLFGSRLMARLRARREPVGVLRAHPGVLLLDYAGPAEALRMAAEMGADMRLVTCAPVSPLPTSMG